MAGDSVCISRPVVAALLAAAQAWERTIGPIQTVGPEAEAMWRLGQTITEAERVLTHEQQAEQS